MESVTMTPTPTPDLPSKPDRWLTRAEKRNATIRMRKVLQARFPLAFQPSFQDGGGPKQPLKVGIREDVLEAAPDLNRLPVLWAIRDYACGLSYHRAMLAGAARVDLQGQPAGEVTAEQAAFHAGHAERITARHDAHKQVKARKPGAT